MKFLLVITAVLAAYAVVAPAATAEEVKVEKREADPDPEPLFFDLFGKSGRQRADDQEFSSCVDGNKRCPSWAQRGECSKNPRYMLKNCQKSCNRCSSSSILKNRKLLSDDAQPIDCQWGAWGSWSTCSKSCGEGKQNRYRIPYTRYSGGAVKAGQFWGRQCSGSNSQTKSCNIRNCGPTSAFSPTNQAKQWGVNHCRPWVNQIKDQVRSQVSYRIGINTLGQYFCNYNYLSPTGVLMSLRAKREVDKYK